MLGPWLGTMPVPLTSSLTTPLHPVARDLMDARFRRSPESASQRVLSKLVTKSQAGSPEILLPVMNECPIYPQNLNKTEHRGQRFSESSQKNPARQTKVPAFPWLSLCH